MVDILAWHYFLCDRRARGNEERGRTMRDDGTRTQKRMTIGRLATVVVLLTGCATLQQIASFERPGFEVERIDVTGLGLQGGSFNLVLDVTNPNAYDLPTTRFNVSIDLEDTHFGTVDVDDAPTLTKNAITTVFVPVQFTWSGVGAGARALLTRGAVRYLVNTQVELDTPLGTRGVNTRLAGEVPLVELLRR